MCVCVCAHTCALLSNSPVDLCRSGGVMGNPESLLAVLLIYAHKHKCMRVLGGADTVYTLQAPVSDPGDHMTYCSCSSNCTYQNEFMASWGYRVQMCSCDESLGPNISPNETFRWTESAFSGSNITGLCYMLVLNFTTGFVADFVEAEVERRSHCQSVNNHSGFLFLCTRCSTGSQGRWWHWKWTRWLATKLTCYEKSSSWTGCAIPTFLGRCKCAD